MYVRSYGKSERERESDIDYSRCDVCQLRETIIPNQVVQRGSEERWRGQLMWRERESKMLTEKKGDGDFEREKITLKRRRAE